MANVILLKDEGRYFRKEAEAESAITPGHLIELTSTGTVQPHSTIGAQARIAFADSNDLIGRDFDAAFVAGDQVRYVVPSRGCELNALVSETVAIGDFLESAGDGTLQITSTPIVGSTLAVALAARTGAGRVRVEIL